VQSTAASQNELLFDEAVTASERLHAAEAAEATATTAPKSAAEDHVADDSHGADSHATTETTVNAH
jgi:hypothetical protein